MKNTITLSLAILMTLCVCAQAGRPKDGKYIERWPNGKIKVEGYYVNYRPDGQWTWYHQNGKVQIKVRYIKGAKTGLEERFDKEGRVLLETEYRDGVRHGKHLDQSWREEDGRWVVYQKTTGSYYKGLRDGRWLIEWSDGRVREIRYKRGKLIS